MEGMTRTRRNRASLLAIGAVAVLGVAGCGSDDEFENKPRPPVPVQLTGVITDSRVTVSPDAVGAGPIILTVANETDSSHTLTLEGQRIQERTGPINPNDTAQIQKTLEEGRYTVVAGSRRAVEPDEQIEPATLDIGPERESGSDELLLP
jgi:hypothetical protein